MPATINAPTNQLNFKNFLSFRRSAKRLAIKTIKMPVRPKAIEPKIPKISIKFVAPKRNKIIGGKKTLNQANIEGK